MLEAVRALRSVVVTGYAGREVTVDRYPQCKACGRTLAEYLARPWSQKCQRCNAQCRNE